MDIRELMTDDLGKVKEFADCCDEMINSRYILAEGKIIKILQTVATSTVLQRVIGDALKGFDYSAAAADWSAGKVKPPFAERYHIALLFCILADVDSRKIYLSDFLRKFFWDGDINSSYAGFVAVLLRPFKDYVVRAVNKVEQKVNTVDNARIDRRAMELAEAIHNHPALSQGDKENYILLCDSIASTARIDIIDARNLAAELKPLLNELDLAPRVANLYDELGN